MKAISIIIVTYNSGKHIRRCLDSIFAQAFNDYEIIVIDNSSVDDTVKIINESFPGIVLIQNKINLGVCSARNQGIEKSHSRFILCLDPDTQIKDNFLKKMFAEIEIDSSLGAVGPKILLEDGKTVYSEGIYPSFLWRFYDIKKGTKDNKKLDLKKEVFGVSSAAALYRREALDSIKEDSQYFDSEFFYFFEDVDISWRLRNKKWRIVYIPGAEALHTAGASRKTDKLSRYYCLRNRYFLLIKNSSRLNFVRILLVFLLYDLWRDMLAFCFSPGYFLRGMREVYGFAKKHNSA